MGYPDPVKPTLDELAQEVNGKDLSHGQASGVRFAALQGRRHDRRRVTGSTPAAIRPSGQLRETPRRGPRIRRRTTRPGLGFIRTGPGAGRSTGACSTIAPPPISTGKPWNPEAAGHPVERHQVGRRRAGLPADDEPRGPNAWLPFIMNGEGSGAFLELAARRTAPRALRAGRVAGRQPAASAAFRRRRSRFCTTRRRGVRTALAPSRTIPTSRPPTA